MPRAVSTLVFVLVAGLVGSWSFAARAAEKSIVVFGDSLSAAYGLPQARGWVALLGERVRRERPDYIVANASISGETSAGGLARVAKVLEQHTPAVMVLELGANDGLRGLPVAQMKKNLGEIIARAQKARARVLVVGMRLPPNYGPQYTAAFDNAFAELAKRHRTAYVPFLLEGFAEKPEFFQPDRIHPSADAQPLMMERVWKALVPLLN